MNFHFIAKLYFVKKHGVGSNETTEAF